MALLHPVVSFQHKGRVVRCGESVEDATLSVSAGELRDAVDLGKHPVSGKWLSPLLNHCVPADRDAEEFFGEKAKKEEKKDDSEEIETLRAEFDQIGKSYDKRWQLPRLQNELAKAKKEVGA